MGVRPDFTNDMIAQVRNNCGFNPLSGIRYPSGTSIVEPLKGVQEHWDHGCESIKNKKQVLECKKIYKDYEAYLTAKWSGAKEAESLSRSQASPDGCGVGVSDLSRGSTEDLEQGSQPTRESSSATHQ